MKTIVFVVFLVAAALAAPEGKREKRGYLNSDWSSAHLTFHDYEAPIIAHAPIIESHVVHKPIHKLVAVKKIVEVPRIIHVKKLVSVPKLVSIPKIVTSHKLVEDHSSSHHFPSSGWW